MNIPKEAIEKAIVEGWSGPPGWVMDAAMIIEKLKVFGKLTHDENCVIALDPTFWQSLGKALGWGKNWNPTIENGQYLEEWYDTAHRFYDLILQGKPTDDFWKSILSTV